ncbi:MAG: hypothetical protein HQK54_12080 [Oligoflexales bacterium]|nr:hypothetical protein [Oligoflexales bacterium]
MTKLIPSKNEGRRLIDQGGIYLNEKNIDTIAHEVPFKELEGEGLHVRKGKKHHYYIRFSS